MKQARAANKNGHCTGAVLIRRHQIFLGGSSDENEKVLGKFLARLRRAKKRSSQIFRLRRAFFRRGGTENR